MNIVPDKKLRHRRINANNLPKVTLLLVSRGSL